MEKIAIISDVHSNITAFKAVIEDIRKRDITRIFCAGDLVLKGSSPCEVLDLAKEKCEVIVRGNAEEGAMCGETPHKTWHRETLGKERMEFISQLPLYFDFYMSGSLIRMFHASKNDTHFRIMDFDNAEEKSSLSINFVRVPYDIEKEIEIARKNNIPSLENYILELKTGMYRKNKKVKE